MVIFDQYKLNQILPPHYFNNIVRYVEEGGAFLEASGPSFTGDHSVYTTVLKSILPGAPDGSIIEEAFIPTLTEEGKEHPVTMNLDPSNWGQWLRQIVTKTVRGDVLMNGAQGHPLLVLDRAGEGRVAHIMSDHLWLWSKDYNNGGPYAALLRRIVHWLMKEPELDERALNVSVKNGEITLRQSSFAQRTNEISMTTPRGTVEIITLEKNAEDHMAQARIRPENIGAYRFTDSEGSESFAFIGNLNPLEFSDLVTSEAPLHDIVKHTGGRILWLEDTPEPSLKMVKKGHAASGRGWIGLRDNDGYIVSGFKSRPALPYWLSMGGLLSLLAALWWREGRKSS